jgi:hypothetical protein
MVTAAMPALPANSLWPIHCAGAARAWLRFEKKTPRRALSSSSSVRARQSFAVIEGWAMPGFLRPLRHERHAPPIWPRQWMHRTIDFGFVRRVFTNVGGFVRQVFTTGNEPLTNLASFVASRSRPRPLAEVEDPDLSGIAQMAG